MAELRCEEKKLGRQLEVIKKALTDLGCEEVPPGCDIPIESPLDTNHENQACFLSMFVLDICLCASSICV